MLKLESPRAIPLANAADFEFSSSPTSSVSLSLDSNTQSILHSFLAERDQERALFNQFQLAAYGGVPVVASTPPNEVGELEKSEEDEDEEIAPSMMSLTDYRLAFREDWQLSQFWYSNAFAEKLAHWLHCLSATSNPKIAFISSPTAFVAFQSLHPSPHARLLEYDERLRVLDPKRFVSYDLDEPEDGIPDGIKEKMDIVVVDPPYLNERTNSRVSRTIRLLLRPTMGKLVVITSTSVEDVIYRVYASYKLRRVEALEVEHGGGLANDFAVWVSTSNDQDARDVGGDGS